MPTISAKATNCLYFRQISALYQSACSQYPRPCLKFLLISFLMEYNRRRPALRLAGRRAGSPAPSVAKQA
ncbi:hypothetical protein [Bradyrhizobium sp. WSM1743]|uniref:hypothetical protein n=1 Tax=Bradyrhizobium sp. WSM1743 TaxID=318996 RepID=UPI0012EBD0A6|nr:hypothetical protein [Bradyrhizobium sp. WSM1743]